MATAIYRDNVPSGATKITFSAWVKRCGLVSGSHQQIFSAYTSNDRRAKVYFTSDSLHVWEKDSSGNEGHVYTTRLFRDINAWYHIVVAQDNTLSTDTDRIKIYINGVRETAVSWSGSKPTQDSTTWILGHGKVMHGNGYYNGSYESQSLNGLMSAINVCYGNAYDASYFGSVDSTTGQWKINTSPSVTYGTQGYSILNNGNTITDQSDNTNNFSLGQGTLTATKDCPSNVFATLNFLYGNGSYTFENGNNSLEANNTNNWGITVPATLGATSGKYYWEARQVAGSHTDYNVFSFIQTDYNYTGSNLIASAYLNGIQTHSGGTCTLYVGTNNSNYAKSGGSNISISDDDIVSFALDIDNQKGWIAKNGVWIDDLSGNVGNPTTGANALFTSSTIPSGQMYSPCSIQYYDPKCQYNFGNGTFGTTAITTNSGNGYAGAEGFSIFNYQPPTGYSALSTKGLNA